MTLLWGLLTLLGAAAAIAVGWVLALHYPINDWLLNLYTQLASSVSTSFSFDNFLLAALAACALVTLLVICACAWVCSWMVGVLAISKLRRSAAATAAKAAYEHYRDQVRHEYERITTLGRQLAQRLDKQTILQNVLLSACQVTSVPRVDSAAGLWLLDFETDQMRFARGVRCDESYFSKREFLVAEAPVVQLLAQQKVMRGEKWQDVFPFLIPEKASLFGEAQSVLVIPFIIEQTVLGFLVVFCHPDLLRAYDELQQFLNAVWGQLTLALAAAVQEELAILDRLTGVANHAYFMKRLNQEIDRSNRYQLPIGLLMIDIDNFKMVNDTLGHPQGDAVLKIVARLIKREIRAIDSAGRYGGEEFIVMLPETGMIAEPGQKSGAEIVAERIRKTVEEEFKHFPKPLAITVSIGIAVRRFPDDRQKDSRDLVRLADDELYKAKTSGKNRYSLYMPADGPGQASGRASQAPTAPPEGSGP